MTQSTAARIARRLQPGMRVAIADGAGAPVGLIDDITEAARSVGGISLLLGWCLELPVRIDADAFTEIRTIMGGAALRGPIADGAVRYVPERYGALPALLSGPLRPDVLIAGLAPGSDGWAWGPEVAWMSSVLDAGAVLLVEENDALPRTSADPLIAHARGEVVATTSRPPIAMRSSQPDDLNERIGRHIADWIPEGAAVQYGPGPLADATFAALNAPISIRSGMISDSVMDLQQRGLLLDDPVATYVVGSPAMYEWADGRPLTTRLERTHDPAFGRPAPFIAINSALEIDVHGAVNVEGLAGRSVAGIGGHPDYALNGHRSVGGLSIIATTTQRRGVSTLVDQLSFPASTARSDVDVVVTENGSADLRGLDDAERGAALRALWNPPA